MIAIAVLLGLLTFFALLIVGALGRVAQALETITALNTRFMEREER